MGYQGGSGNLSELTSLQLTTNIIFSIVDYQVPVIKQVKAFRADNLLKIL